MTETYTYDAFGTLKSIQALNKNGILETAETALGRFLYAGEQYDNITGLYYLRARRFDITIGRFTQEDTYLGDGRNLYVYVGNNPLKYVDPSGHEEVVAVPFGAYYENWIERLKNFGGSAVGQLISGYNTFASEVRSNYVYVSTVLADKVNTVTDALTVTGGWEVSSGAATNYYAANTLGVGIDMFIASPALAIDSQTFSNALDEVNFGYVALTAGTGSATASSGGVNNGKCGSGGKNSGKGIIQKVQEQINNLLSNKTLTRRTGKVENYESSEKGYDVAKADFDSLNLENVRTYSGGIIVGNMLDGRSVNIHPSTTLQGVPSLEIYNPVTGCSIKIRY